MRRTDPTDPDRDMSFEPIEDPADCDCGKIITRGEVWFLGGCAVIITVLVALGVFL